MTTSKQYDIVLFGVTGFTGKLCAEYLLEKKVPHWAACARNPTKASATLDEIAGRVGSEPPPLLTADLLCTTDEQRQKLREIVEQTRVVLTCAGPFEKYGQTLVQLCSEAGVSYCDITGETDFVRLMIQKYDATARESGAAILSHCGNDCLPQSLSVFALHAKAQEMGGRLQQVRSYVDIASSASFSGGTAATAAFQLSKDRSKAADKPPFDPLLRTADGTKSEFGTKNITPKSTITVPEMQRQAGPWIMAPVMVNAVRRANALLGYAKDLEYGDAMLKQPLSWSEWTKQQTFALALGATIFVPSFGRFLPQPGEGPDRQTMEDGWFTLHTFATVSTPETKKLIKSRFHFNKDVAYLYTAALICETGLLLLEKVKANTLLSAGVVTPEAALGHDLLQRILDNMDTEFEIEELEAEDS